MRRFLEGSAQGMGMLDRAGKSKTGMIMLALAIFLFALSPICRAQTDASADGAVQTGTSAAPAGNAGADPAANSGQMPVRVVRLSDVEGAVQILSGGQVEFQQAAMNMPLSPGSQIKTGAGRAEIEFEDGSVARITPNSSLRIEALDASSQGAMLTTVAQVSGLIYYELRSGPRTTFKVTFGDRTATPTANSTFRINLNANPQDLAVIDGRVQVQGASDSYLAEVPQGKTIQFESSGNAQYTIANWIAPNGFDDWNDQRDQEAAQEAKNQTPARVQQGGGSIMDSGIGWSDLDNAGGWYPLPGYGMVWQPYGAGSGFDPYGYGTWANFGGGFGYSWVSGYSWGWLPFHCGSWSYIGSFGWGWMPGAYGCGGYGFGYGGYGYGRRWRHGLYLRTNVYKGPAGYHAPVAPAISKGQQAPRIVRVGNPQPGLGTAGVRTGRGNNAARAVNFNGTKISPLHSMMNGTRVPTRNAALYNNYPAHAFQGNVRTALLEHNASVGHGMGSGLRGPSATGRGESFNAARGEPLASHAFGGTNRGLGSPNRAFGQHTSFGPHGSFGAGHSASAGGGFRSGGGVQNSGGFHGGGFSGGGFHGGGGGGGFHGGGGGGGHSGH